MTDSDRRPDFCRERAAMIDEQLRKRGIRDERILRAMQTVPRHEFVPANAREHAYADRPLEIGHGQTISQPYIVAFMTQMLSLRGTERVLEIGTGCGYQTAILAELCGRVFSIEIVPELGRQAAETLGALGYRNVRLRIGDGHAGWPEEQPFDRVLVAAAPTELPPALAEQLADGGRIILPIGDTRQRLVMFDRTQRGLERSGLLPVRFVPMTGGP